MSGFSRALAEDYGAALDGEAKTYLDQIGIASRRMSDLVDGLLVLSRSTRGELRRDAVDLSALAGRVLADLARQEPARRVTVAVAPGLTAEGDARMIEAALANLLGNAWKYTAHAEAAHIRLAAERRDGTDWYCVADNGAGFDMAHAGRLFQPFQRLHRQDEFPGIGEARKAALLKGGNQLGIALHGPGLEHPARGRVQMDEPSSVQVMLIHQCIGT